ncbi:MAG: fibronectin type III domain-containing protein, partial [Candidatus Cloacimonadaceae bacterium]|nr:fibronectin type III domain-containing protein [Candidatus Cloacimonadaceae bacterium]
MAISDQYSALNPVRGMLNPGSDSSIFYLNGFKAVFMRERYRSPYYHLAEDVIDHLDFEYARQILRAATATVATYANQPEPLQNVQCFDTGTGSSLLVQWDSSMDPELSHYIVYYGTDEMAMDLWHHVSGNEYLIEGLVEGQQYNVAVAAVTANGFAGNRRYSEGTPLSVPRSPQGLADFPGSSSIVITWTPNAELDISSYNIYRSFGAQGTSVLIASINSPQASYTDHDVSSSLEYYYYRLQAIDIDGNQSQLTEALSSRMVSLDRGILVIDESKNFNSPNPFLPSDEDVDEFYARVLNGFEHVEHLDLEEYNDTLRVADIGIYSSILWHGNDNADYIYPFKLREVLKQYIYWGGQILFSVYFPDKAFEMNAEYPAIFPPDSFINEVLGIGGANYSVGARFKYAIPNHGSFPALQVDSLKTMASWQGHSFAVVAMEAVNQE